MNGANTDNVPHKKGGDFPAADSRMTGPPAKVEAEANAAAAATVTPDFIRIVSAGTSDASEGGTWTISPSPRVRPAEPHPTNDALCGKGGRTNNHEGHKRFLKLVRRHRPEYEAASKLGKRDVATKVMGMWRAQDPPGRFVHYDELNKTWTDVGDEKALAKVYQALRDGREGPKGGAAQQAARSMATNDDGADDLEPMPLRGTNDQDLEIDHDRQAFLFLTLHDDPEAIAGPEGVSFVKVTDKDCIMGPAGHTKQRSGTCQFWEWVGQGSDAYKASPDHEKDAMADWYVNEWLAKGGRFVRQEEKRHSLYAVGNLYATAMVKYFMSHPWILTPHDTSDYLLGKGGQTINHPGSNRFRAAMQKGKSEYNRRPSHHRRSYAEGYAKSWRNGGGRFLQLDETIGLWHEASDDAARAMVQTFMSRKDAPKEAPAMKLELVPPTKLGDAVLGRPIQGSTLERSPPSVFANNATPVFMSSRCRVGIRSFGTAPSSDWSESRREETERTDPESSTSPAPPPPPAPKTKGRMVALARWASRVLEPARRMFRRGRNRGPLVP